MNENQLKQKYGCDDIFVQFADLPKKMSGTKVSRVLFGEIRGCSYCFPHGSETNNSTELNSEKNWKFKQKYKKQWQRNFQNRFFQYV